MSSRAATKAQARERVAAMRAEQARKERRRRVLLAGTAVLVVILLVAGLVVAKIAGVGSGSGSTDATKGSGENATTASPAVFKDVTTVPTSVLNTIGPGSAASTPRKISAPALTVGGKPQVLYVGAEYCPYCAAQRWALAVALSRFGTFDKLGATHSATNDVYPDTQTLSFHDTTFTSPYLSFTGVETLTNTQQPLDSLSSADKKTESTYNTAKYVGSPGIPFLDIGGRYVSAGTYVDPKLLAGKSREQIAAALATPGSPIAKSVDGSANIITAAICDVTKGTPAKVCTAPGVGASFAAFGKTTQ
jgi:hypothetical protein